MPLIEMCLSSGLKLKDVLADGTYDTKEIFGYLSNHKILATIHLRKDASTRSMTCPARGKEARYIKIYGLDEWKKSRKYARPVAVERAFGSYKTVFDDYVRAKLWEHMIFEVITKFWLYQYILLREYME
ncbi:MAG: transposase [Promethearchaeota archaeon]